MLRMRSTISICSSGSWALPGRTARRDHRRGVLRRCNCSDGCSREMAFSGGIGPGHVCHRRDKGAQYTGFHLVQPPFAQVSDDAQRPQAARTPTGEAFRISHIRISWRQSACRRRCRCRQTIPRHRCGGHRGNDTHQRRKIRAPALGAGVASPYRPAAMNPPSPPDHRSSSDDDHGFPSPEATEFAFAHRTADLDGMRRVWEPGEGCTRASARAAPGRPQVRLETHLRQRHAPALHDRQRARARRR